MKNTEPVDTDNYYLIIDLVWICYLIIMLLI